MRTFNHHLSLSVTIHVIVIGVFMWVLKFEPLHIYKKISTAFVVQLEGASGQAQGGSRSSLKASESKKHSAAQASSHATKIARTYDLRPSFAKNGILFSDDAASARSSGGTSLNNNGLTNGFAKELLLTESKVFQVFDQLAARINTHLDYPSLLAENGVQGVTTLELFFDGNGDIDEGKSKCFGDNRIVRGLLVKAVRYGLLEWFANDAMRLEKEKFRNQHFRADFEISYFLTEKSTVTKTMMGNYAFVRRRSANTCIGPAGAGAVGMDVACVAVRAGGIIKSLFSGDYKTKFYALVDTLERYDEIGLAGVNAAAHERI